MNCNVTNHWTDLIKEQATAMVTLKHLYIEGFRPKSMHPLWTTSETTRIGIIRSCNMAKVIVGRYYLEVDYAKFKGGPSTCRLCTLADGNLRHFVLICPALSEARDDHLQKITSIVCKIQGSNDWDILQMMLDPQVVNSDIQPGTLEELRDLSKQLLLKLHQRRSILLGNLRPPAPYFTTTDHTDNWVKVQIISLYHLIIDFTSRSSTIFYSILIIIITGYTPLKPFNELLLYVLIYALTQVTAFDDPIYFTINYYYFYIILYDYGIHQYFNQAPKQFYKH